MMRGYHEKRFLSIPALKILALQTTFWEPNTLNYMILLVLDFEICPKKIIF